MNLQAGLTSIVMTMRTAGAEAEQIVEAMVRQILSTKPYEVIHGQKFPRASVESAMMKANIFHLQNVVEQMKEVLNIRNYVAYLISSIYNEVVNYHVKIMQKAVQSDMTSGRLSDIKTIDSLFYIYHSECESIIIDMVTDKIDKKTLDIIFADLDELQEDFHNRLKDLY